MAYLPDDCRPSSQASRDSWRLLRNIKSDRPPINEDGVLRLCYGLKEEKEALRRDLIQAPRKNDYDHQTGPWLEELTNLSETAIYRVHKYMLSRPPASCQITYMAAKYGFCLEAVKPQLFTIDGGPGKIHPRIVDSEVWERENATMERDDPEGDRY